MLQGLSSVPRPSRCLNGCLRYGATKARPPVGGVWKAENGVADRRGPLQSDIREFVIRPEAVRAAL